MPYILFGTYYKYAEWESSIVDTDEDLIGLAEDWLQEKGYDVPDDKSIDNMIDTLLECGQETISNEAGWGYVKIYRVSSITSEWGPGSGCK